jgi:heme A synthase
MLFIWKGKGLWVFVIIGICLVITGSFFASLAHHRSIGLLLAALVNWFVGKNLNKNTKRDLIDEKTKEKITIDNSHTFFFINMEWWSIILIILGILTYIDEN